MTIPPGVVHAFRNTGDAAMVLVSFSTNLHDPAGADTQREQILCTILHGAAMQVISFKNTALFKRGIWLSAAALIAFVAGPAAR